MSNTSKLLRLLQDASRQMEAASSLAHRMGQMETDLVYPIEASLRRAVDDVAELADRRRRGEGGAA